MEVEQTPVVSDQTTTNKEIFPNNIPVSPQPKKSKKVLYEILFLLILLLGSVGYCIFRLPLFEDFIRDGGKTPQTFPTTPTQTAIPTSTLDVTADWNVYKSTPFSFSFLYPSTLTLYDQLKQIGDNLLLQNFQALPNRKEVSSDFQLVLSVSKDEGKTLEEYPKLWEKDFGSLPSEKLLIGNVNAIKGFSGQKYLAVPTVWLINSGYLYTIQLSTPESTNKNLFDQILSTFKFTDQTTD